MKKALMILMLMAIAFAGYAQDGNLKKQTYFRFGISSPSWKYKGFDNKSDWFTDFDRIGYIFETGSIFMINSLKIAPDMRLGINVDYLSASYHKFSVGDNQIRENYFYIGSKIGPSFSYSPVKRLVFDVYAKFNPVWVAGSLWTDDSDLSEDQFYMGFMGIKWSVGLNVRYSLLMLGFEFNPGYAKFKKYDTENNEFSDIYMENSVDNSKRIPVPAMNFTIGISL